MTTIFALSTPWGRSGVAIIRLSGGGAAKTLMALTHGVLPEPRKAVKRRLRTETGPIDDALVIWFPGPASFTGEDVVEFCLHGGPAIIEAMLMHLSQRPDHRLAEPGEFSKIAFFNGKLDLVEIEGLADLLAAETERQRIQALWQADGSTSSLYETWRHRELELMALQEAEIDFSDEDIPLKINETIKAGMKDLLKEMENFLEDGRKGERLRLGAHIAILGAPNAGKSSLLNRLAGRGAAIVTAIAGTTRDVLEIRLDLGGFPLTLADTAGLRDSQDEIEQEGIRRALREGEKSDLNILVFDGAIWPKIDKSTQSLIDERSILVLNKADLAAIPPGAKIGGKEALSLSALTGEGMKELLANLQEKVGALMPKGDGPIVARARHRAAIAEAAAALRRGLEAKVPELRAEELRVSANALGRLVGKIDVEEILGEIFREFCIGK